MGSLGPWEILIIAGVIILLFGAKKMPEMARSLGKSARILKAETKGMKGDDAETAEAASPVVAPQQQLPQAQPPGPQVAPPIEQTQQNKNAG